LNRPDGKKMEIVFVETTRDVILDHMAIVLLTLLSRQTNMHAVQAQKHEPLNVDRNGVRVMQIVQLSGTITA